MIQNLQSLRLLFILLIVFSHIKSLHFDFGGDCGVAFFFTISGFVLSVSKGKAISEGDFSTLHFLKHQLSKFYPLHVLTFVATAIIGLCTQHFEGWLHAIANILLVQSWIPLPDYYFSFNGVSWFLSNILFCYLLFLPLYLLINRHRPQVLAITAIAIAAVYAMIASQLPAERVNALLYIPPYLRIIDFAIGILTARVFLSDRFQGNRLIKKYRQDTLWCSVCQIAGVFLLILTYYCYTHGLPFWMTSSFVFWPIMFLEVLLFATTDCCPKGVLSRLLQSKGLKVLRNYCLEIYLLQLLSLKLSGLLESYLGLNSLIPLCVLIDLAMLFALAALVKSLHH